MTLQRLKECSRGRGVHRGVGDRAGDGVGDVPGGVSGLESADQYVEAGCGGGDAVGVEDAPRPKPDSTDE